MSEYKEVVEKRNDLPFEFEGKEIVIRIPCKKGLHMPTAANFINFAKQFKSNIKLTHGDVTVDAKSILGILLLGVNYYSPVKIRVTGEDAGATLQALKTYFEKEICCTDDES